MIFIWLICVKIKPACILTDPTMWDSHLNPLHPIMQLNWFVSVFYLLILRVKNLWCHNRPISLIFFCFYYSKHCSNCDTFLSRNWSHSCDDIWWPSCLFHRHDSNNCTCLERNALRLNVCSWSHVEHFFLF